jgi:ketosteroid isomerase-like protein
VRRRRKERQEAMCIRKRTLVACGVAVVSLALLAGVLGMPDTARPAAAQVDWCQKVQQVTDALNRREIDLVLENYADDMVVVAAPLCAPCVGKDGYRNHLEYAVALDTQMTVTSCQVSGSTIAVTYEMRARDVREAGVDRVIISDAYELEGDKVVSASTVGVDMADPQTAQYITWVAVHGGFATFAMGPGRDADQSPGLASLELSPDFSEVSLGIARGPRGVPQPVNIHEGTCADLGPVAFALKDIADGRSQTLLDGVPGSDLQTGNFAIAVQKSHDEPDVYVACGDIPAAAAQVPPAEAPAVAPAPAAELPSAGSGGLLGEEGSSLPTWWYALPAGGILLIMAGLAGQWRVRRRR